MTTLVDVARRAGVSKSTVSNVLRGGVLVAEATRERVQRAMAETGYQPNAIARSLKARSSTALGILVPDLTNPYFAELSLWVERTANGLGYIVLTAHTECVPSVEYEAGRALIERRVDGVIIAGISLHSALPKMLLDRGIPVMLVSFGGLDDERLGVIDHNDEIAMEAITDHLYSLSHRHVAFAPQQLREHSGERRRLGLIGALARRSLKLVELERATAIVAHNDVEAIGLINQFERQGIRVPEDVSIVGYDDIPMAVHSRIGLTTVRSNAASLARRAVELVVAASREDRHVCLREVVSNSLIIRSTTAMAAR
jgi:LacI family transcriptional regulator